MNFIKKLSILFLVSFFSLQLVAKGKANQKEHFPLIYLNFDSEDAQKIFDVSLFCLEDIIDRGKDFYPFLVQVDVLKKYSDYIDDRLGTFYRCFKNYALIGKSKAQGYLEKQIGSNILCPNKWRNFCRNARAFFIPKTNFLFIVPKSFYATKRYLIKALFNEESFEEIELEQINSYSLPQVKNDLTVLSTIFKQRAKRKKTLVILDFFICAHGIEGEAFAGWSFDECDYFFDFLKTKIRASLRAFFAFTCFAAGKNSQLLLKNAPFNFCVGFPGISSSAATVTRGMFERFFENTKIIDKRNKKSYQEFHERLVRGDETDSCSIPQLLLPGEKEFRVIPNQVLDSIKVVSSEKTEKVVCKDVAAIAITSKCDYSKKHFEIHPTRKEVSFESLYELQDSLEKRSVFLNFLPQKKRDVVQDFITFFKEKELGKVINFHTEYPSFFNYVVSFNKELNDIKALEQYPAFEYEKNKSGKEWMYEKKGPFFKSLFSFFWGKDKIRDLSYPAINIATNKKYKKDLCPFSKIMLSRCIDADNRMPIGVGAFFQDAFFKPVFDKKKNSSGDIYIKELHGYNDLSLLCEMDRYNFFKKNKIKKKASLFEKMIRKYIGKEIILKNVLVKAYYDSVSDLLKGEISFNFQGRRWKSSSRDNIWRFQEI